MEQVAERSAVLSDGQGVHIQQSVQSVGGTYVTIDMLDDREKGLARIFATSMNACVRVAVYCSVWQCGNSVCCSVWGKTQQRQCARYLCCGALQCVAVRYSVLQCVAVCCIVLQCVTLCYSVLQCVGARHSMFCNIIGYRANPAS